MLTGFSFGYEGKNFSEKRLLGAMRMNQYTANWHIVLEALRQLWETGKVTKLETPYFESIEKSWHK